MQVPANTHPFCVVRLGKCLDALTRVMGKVGFQLNQARHADGGVQHHHAKNELDPRFGKFQAEFDPPQAPATNVRHSTAA